MPHVVISAWPGKTECQMQALADRITADVIDVLASGAQPASVALEEVSPRDRAVTICRQDTGLRPDTLNGKPGDET